MREFKFFRGYVDKTITERLEELLLEYPLTTTGTTWTTNPGYIQYPTPNYIITTTPGTGTYTIPYSGTVNMATGFSLTTSNPNGTTYTTGGFGGTLTTNTATFTSNIK